MFTVGFSSHPGKPKGKKSHAKLAESLASQRGKWKEQPCLSNKLNISILVF